MALCVAAAGVAQDVTVRAKNRPAAEVFRSLIEQTGKNFVYSSDLLENVRVSVSATNKPLKKVLDEMFAGTGIEYKIKGKNVVLKRSRKKEKGKKKQIKNNVARPTLKTEINASELPTMLEEVVIVSRLESPVVETAEIGAKKVTADEVRNTPSLFGESDVIKALQMQPGVSDGTEGMAGMHVHGGNNDENLYMLDNVPIYQINHFAGLFSAFNTDIIRYIDFFKSSFPAKYDGRLSSFMDVRLMNGHRHGHHGSARLGLTSGAFNISGPIGGRTTYLVGLRRSWYDVLTIPVLALVNSGQTEKVRFRYHFMDFNANVSHRLNDNANIFLKAYFGDDNIEGGTDDRGDAFAYEWKSKDRNDFHWGNFVAQAGMNYRFDNRLSAEFTAAYTRFFSSMKYNSHSEQTNDSLIAITDEKIKTSNNINDWIFSIIRKTKCFI